MRLRRSICLRRLGGRWQPFFEMTSLPIAGSGRAVTNAGG
jgi:hypothetical protein